MVVVEFVAWRVACGCGLASESGRLCVGRGNKKASLLSVV